MYNNNLIIFIKFLYHYGKSNTYDSRVLPRKKSQPGTQIARGVTVIMSTCRYHEVGSPFLFRGEGCFVSTSGGKNPLMYSHAC